MLSIFTEHEHMQNLFASAVVFLTLITFRFLAVRQITQLKISPAEAKRSLTVRVKNGFIILIVFSLVAIWSDEIKTIAISLVAIAAALAIATKEFILCLIGGLYKWVAKPFTIGDRIEIGPHKGDVVDYKFLTTSLLEIGPSQELTQYTGKTLVIPNSLYLTFTVTRLSHSQKYTLHSFVVPIIYPNENWQFHETQLLEAAKTICGPYILEAQRFFKGESHGFILSPASIEPRVSLVFPKPDQLDFVVRIPCQSMQTNRTQQAILRLYLELVYQKEKLIETNLRSGATGVVFTEGKN